jgi:hypothetical protein
MLVLTSPHSRMMGPLSYILLSVSVGTGATLGSAAH